MLDEDSDSATGWLWNGVWCCSSRVRPRDGTHRIIRLQHHERRLRSLITCPNCRMPVRTRSRNIITPRTHMAAVAFCGFPYLFKTFKDQKHYCPLCKAFIATAEFKKIKAISCFLPEVEEDDEWIVFPLHISVSICRSVVLS